MFINTKSEISPYGGSPAGRQKPKQYLISKAQNSKHGTGTGGKKYDLEDRALLFAENCRDFIKMTPKGIANFEYAKQLVRSSGSVIANYIEANESISRKDFSLRIRICRKEAKESHVWLRLLVINNQQDLRDKQSNLIQEALELTRIFASIMKKVY